MAEPTSSGHASGAIPHSARGDFSERRRLSLERLIAVLGALLLISPKVNLISVTGQTAGLRIDDLILFCMWIPLLAYLHRAGLRGIRTYGYATFIAYAFASVALASAQGWPPQVLYMLRLVEYSTFIFIGIVFARTFDIGGFLALFVSVNTLVMVAQYFGLMGGFTVAGYQGEVGRVVGLTAGPWEIGYLLDIAYILVVARFRIVGVRLVALTALILILLVMTGSRAATAVFAVVAVVLMLRGSNPVKALLQLAGGSIILLLVLFFAGGEVLSRSKNILDVANVEYVREYSAAVVPDGKFDAEEFENVAELESADQSWIIRSSHWIIALQEWRSSVSLTLFGVGLGTFGPALDGAWTRLLTETGIMGMVLFGSFMLRIRKVLPYGVLIAFVTAANMVFIDIHLSYKSMAFLLFLVGYYQWTPSAAGDNGRPLGQTVSGDPRMAPAAV